MAEHEEVGCTKQCRCPKCGKKVSCQCDCHSKTMATCPKCGEVFECK